MYGYWLKKEIVGEKYTAKIEKYTVEFEKYTVIIKNISDFYRLGLLKNLH